MYAPNTTAKALKAIKDLGYAVEDVYTDRKYKGSNAYGGKRQIKIVNPVTGQIIYDRTESANYPTRHLDQLELLNLPEVVLPPNTTEITEETDIDALLAAYTKTEDTIEFDPNFNIFDWFDAA